MKLSRKVINFLLTAIVATTVFFGAAVETAASNMYENSDFVETEQPELSEETKQLISLYQKNPTKENYLNLRDIVIENYNAVLDRKEAKLEELKSETLGKPGGEAIVAEMEEIVQEMYINNSVYTISEKLKNDNWKVSVCNIDEDENNRALKYRTSPKRLKAVEDYTNAFGGTLEDNFAALKGITNKEIYAEIEAADDTPEQNNENASDQKPQGRKYKSSPERLKAVKEYTDMFGGSLEENMQALKGVSMQEIYDAIECQTPIENSVKQ